MTRQRSFKRLVRERMTRTGESYAAARRSLLGAQPTPGGTEPAPLVTTDEKIRDRTGRGWEEWFDLLDGWEADGPLTHRQLSRRVADELGIEPLVWDAQAVTTSYERARRGREVGRRADGRFAVSVTRTVAVSVSKLYRAFAEPSVRDQWLPDGELHERTAAARKSIRFDWADGTTRVHVVFLAKARGKSVATVEHSRLADAAETDRMKAYWRERLTALKAALEGGELDA